MGVAVQKDFNVLKVKSELRNISFNLGRGFSESAIEQKMASRCRDKKRSDFRGADIIKISDDSEWRDRLVPAPAGGISLSKCDRDGEQSEGKWDVDFRHRRA